MKESENITNEEIHELMSRMPEPAPEMRREFENTWFENVKQRKAEMESADASDDDFWDDFESEESQSAQEDTPVQEKKPIPLAWSKTVWFRSLVSIAAALVILVGGTLSTRDMLHRQPITVDPDNPTSITLPVPDGLIQQSRDPQSGASSENGFSEFMADMGLFIKAAWPYLTGAAVLCGAGWLILKKNQKKD